jgi:3-oxoacyl-[acyl-carrier protein] reductase
MAEQRFAGRTVLVTGASRGIGRAIAAAFAIEGAHVIGTATSAAGVADIDQYLASAAGGGAGRILDVGDAASIDALVNRLTTEDKLPQILVNNAGITRDNLLLRMKDDEWHAVINADLTSVFALTRRLLRGMLKEHFGRVINISSVVAASGNAGQANYAAAKAGIIGFTKSVAREVASRGVTINTVSPGFIDTDMTRQLAEPLRNAILGQIPVSRFGRPEEVAAAVLFLASAEAAYITGETLHVNGGMYMS